MRSLSTLGIRTDDLLDPLPELSPRASLAVACWNFCDGWHPERWPLFGAFHDVPDWGACMELMQTLRAEYRRHEEARARG